MKGTDPQEEIVEAKRSLQVLQATFTADHALKLPVEQSERHIVVMSKKGPTPKAYPRKPGTPLKTPIM
jgi:16S rRNA (guanine527-N7)-methyltransferase